jgi:transcriptional regulator with PAS, ATPase and Fis domain
MGDLSTIALGDLIERVRRVAALDMTVLLAGETGTGKTCLARLIHELSLRRRQPFLVIRCGAAVGTLMESELFGHTKGAFIGADRGRHGKFADVGSGTLLLDDIDALSVSLQAKLLHALEERSFEPMGSNRTLPIKARLLAASKRVLDQEVEAGRFRADLYYRLNAASFYLPPLRECPRALQHFAASFVAEFAARIGRPVQGIHTEALQAIERYSWPGNIRELRHAIGQAVALCSGRQIRLDDLPEPVRSATSMGPGLSGSVGEEAEHVQIRAALEAHGNNRTRAAWALGMKRHTFYKKLDRYGLRIKRQR